MGNPWNEPTRYHFWATLVIDVFFFVVVAFIAYAMFEYWTTRPEEVERLPPCHGIYLDLQEYPNDPDLEALYSACIENSLNLDR